MEYPNYIKDSNKFSLAGPPKWFQAKLWEYDPSLVIVPSRQGFYYRLAQRRPLLLKESVIADVLKEQADAAMLARYSLVPVTTILATVQWDSPIFFTKLTDMAPWRHGGAKAFEEKVLAQDKKEWLEKRAAMDDRLNILSKDAWRYYNKKIGTRTHIFDVKGEKSKSEPNVAPAIHIPGAAKPYTPVITSGFGDSMKRPR